MGSFIKKIKYPCQKDNIALTNYTIFQSLNFNAEICYYPSLLAIKQLPSYFFNEVIYNKILACYLKIVLSFIKINNINWEKNRWKKNQITIQTMMTTSTAA